MDLKKLLFSTKTENMTIRVYPEVKAYAEKRGGDVGVGQYIMKLILDDYHRERKLERLKSKAKVAARKRR